MMLFTFWAFVLSTFIIYSSTTASELIEPSETVFGKELKWQEILKKHSPVSCPHKSSVTPILLPDPEDCQKFYICANGIPHLKTCQAGLHFNSKVQACDYPENANCKSGKDPKGKLGEDNPSNMCPTKNTGNPVLLPDSNDCTKFYICDGKTAHLKTCQAGLHFNEKIQACDYPSNVKCDKGTTKEPKGKIGDDSDSSCPAENSVHPILVPHATDCDKFYICDGGVGHLKTCQAGLHFNPKISACDYPQNSKCSGEVSTKSPLGKINDESICPAEKSVLLPHPLQCEKFIMCEKGVAYLKTCPRGLHFNSKSQICDYPANANCKNNIQYAPGFPSPFCPSFDGPEQIFFRHSSDCSIYYMCSHGLAYEFTCPNRLHFNLRKKYCDYEVDANCETD